MLGSVHLKEWERKLTHVFVCYPCHDRELSTPKPQTRNCSHIPRPEENVINNDRHECVFENLYFFFSLFDDQWLKKCRPESGNR